MGKARVAYSLDSAGLYLSASLRPPTSSTNFPFLFREAGPSISRATILNEDRPMLCMWVTCVRRAHGLPAGLCWIVLPHSGLQPPSVAFSVFFVRPKAQQAYA